METTRHLIAHNKYRAVASALSYEHARATLLDIGARDQILKRYLCPQVDYQSADIGPGCDHTIDLEGTLPFEDGAFTSVVALDVLEHVNQFHNALNELFRISSKNVVIGLPNMGYSAQRLSFLLQGKFATNKYDLTPLQTSDRHRWVTTYKQINHTVETIASHRGATRIAAYDEIGDSRLSRILLYPLAIMRLVPRALATVRTIHIISKG